MGRGSLGFGKAETLKDERWRLTRRRRDSEWTSQSSPKQKRRLGTPGRGWLGCCPPGPWHSGRGRATLNLRAQPSQSRCVAGGGQARARGSGEMWGVEGLHLFSSSGRLPPPRVRSRPSPETCLAVADSHAFPLSAPFVTSRL